MGASRQAFLRGNASVAFAVLAGHGRIPIGFEDDAYEPAGLFDAMAFWRDRADRASHRFVRGDDLPQRSYTAEMLHDLFPTLPLDLIEKVLAFARENQGEVDAYVDRCQAEIDHLRATPPRLLDWEKMPEQFEAIKRAERR
jgi:hypothetical protein